MITENIVYRTNTEIKNPVYSEYGDVLIPASDTTPTGLARATSLEKSGVLLGGDINIIRPNEGINGSCLSLALNANRKELIRLIKGTTVRHIHNSEIKDIVICLPKLETEQVRVSSYFKQLDHLITLHQRKYFIIYNKLITWEQRKLGDLVISHNAGIYISKEDYGTGTNVIGVGNIYDNDIFDGEIYRLGPVNDEKFLLEENDLIYGESSLVPEGIARTVCVGKNGVGSAFAWHTRRVKLDQSVINSHFATLELNYNIDVRKYLISVSTQTALTGMTTEGYFGVTLSLPTVEEQAHISSLFKQLDHLITLHRRAL